MPCTCICFLEEEGNIVCALYVILGGLAREDFRNDCVDDLYRQSSKECTHANYLYSLPLDYSYGIPCKELGMWKAYL
jgi:hypothetical protein